MIRRVIEINKEKCDGCGICVTACHEGAIGLVEGKATLLRDDYCDGLGDCLPNCPQSAISFIEREALAYDEEAVKKNIAAKKAQAEPKTEQAFHSCPGTQSRMLIDVLKKMPVSKPASEEQAPDVPSRLAQWPVQIKLAPVNAPYFDNADVLIAADCTAYAYGNFHEEFMKDHVTLIGCPKLDAVEYSEKLGEILKNNDIRSVRVVRMEVPCCGGMEMAVKKAMMESGKFIPWSVITLSADGKIIDRQG